MGGRNKLPMAQLRALVSANECDDVTTHIQSGNVVFNASVKAPALERRLELAIEKEFGFPVPVLVRTAAVWSQQAAANPFPRQSEATPNWVQLLQSKKKPASKAAVELQARATRGEEIAHIDDALWVHYPNGIGDSKLTSALIDRCVGSTVTARNWKTVEKLRALAATIAST